MLEQVKRCFVQGDPLTPEVEALLLSYPEPLGTAVLEMLRDKVLSSADDLVHLIEVWLRHLGWSWVVAYLRLGESHRAIDLLLFRTFVESDRDPSVGGWAYIGSTIARFFQRFGWLSTIPGLDAFSYGDPRDAQSPLSRLLRYRNSFAHGSFSAVLQDILLHRSLLFSLIEPLSLFLSLPILVQDSDRPDDKARWFRLSSRMEAVPPPSPLPDVLPLQPVLALPSGVWIPLSPIWKIRKSQGVKPFEIELFSIKKASLAEKEALFERNPSVLSHLQDYLRGRQGMIDFSSRRKKEIMPPLPDQEKERLIQQIQDALQRRQAQRPTFVLLLGYPGSGKSGLLARVDQLYHGFDIALFYRLSREDGTMSAKTFLRYCIRQIAALCDRPAWLRGIEADLELTDIWQDLLQTFAREGKRLLFALDRFHLAYEAYRDDTERIYDLLVKLQGPWAASCSFLLASRPGYRDDLLQDISISLPIADYEEKDRYDALLAEVGLDLEESTKGLSLQEIRFRRLLLYFLGQADAPLRVFDVYSAFALYTKRSKEPWPDDFLFTPHIERALWEMRPILRWEARRHPEGFDETAFAPFCPMFARWLREHLRPSSRPEGLTRSVSPPRRESDSALGSKSNVPL